jgi:hypothetical protein
MSPLSPTVAPIRHEAICIQVNAPRDVGNLGSRGLPMYCSLRVFRRIMNSIPAEVEYPVRVVSRDPAGRRISIRGRECGFRSGHRWNLNRQSRWSRAMTAAGIEDRPFYAGAEPVRLPAVGAALAVAGMSIWDRYTFWRHSKPIRDVEVAQIREIWASTSRALDESWTKRATFSPRVRNDPLRPDRSEPGDEPLTLHALSSFKDFVAC